MPKFEALYYPNFEPPIDWLRSFLLFFDRIRTIVPKEMDFEPSKEISEISDIIPRAFETVSPKEKHIDLDYDNLVRLRKAFQIIKEKEPKTKHKKIEIQIDKEGRTQIMGYSFIHNTKISREVYSLLKEFGFMRSELKNSFVKCAFGIGSFSIVNESASDLIVSHIADRLARDYGWNTVTDRKIDFTVNALNAFEYRSLKDPRSTLICSIINCEIPQEIQNVKLDRYKEIRDAYSDIRESFHRVIIELSDLYRLETIEDGQVLHERITEITSEFHSEIEELKNSNLGRKVKRWAPIGIGGISSIIGEIFGGPVVGVSIASVSILTKVVQKFVDLKDPRSERDEIYRLIAKMQKDIIKASEVRKLI